VINNVDVENTGSVTCSRSRRVRRLKLGGSFVAAGCGSSLIEEVQVQIVRERGERRGGESQT
jgi:hypothetical protein